VGCTPPPNHKAVAFAVARSCRRPERSEGPRRTQLTNTVLTSQPPTFAEALFHTNPKINSKKEEKIQPYNTCTQRTTKNHKSTTTKPLTHHKKIQLSPKHPSKTQQNHEPPPQKINLKTVT
jgi:hypothetical protein